MGRVLTALGSVVILSSLLVEANTVDRLKLKTIRRTVSADSYTFTVEFQAPTQPDVLWTKTTQKEQVLTLNGTQSYDTVTGEGSAQLTVARETETVRVWLGDRDSHFFTFTLNQGGDQDLTLDLYLPAADVTPSTDVAYTRRRSSTIVVSVQKDRGQGWTCEDTPPGIVGHHYNSANGRLDYVEHTVQPFLRVRESEQGGITTTTYSFLTKQFTVNGFFLAIFSCRPDPSSSTLPIGTLIEEVIEMRVHEWKYAGPFPDSYVDTHTWYDPNWHNLAVCLATANNLDTVSLYKIAGNGTRTLIDSSSHVEFHVIRLAVDLTSHGDDVRGKYVCHTTRKSGGQPNEAFLTVD